MFDGFTRDKGSLFDVVYKHIDIYQDILIVQYSDNIFFFSYLYFKKDVERFLCYQCHSKHYLDFCRSLLGNLKVNKDLVMVYLGTDRL